jgi:hypothetical protein
LLFARLLKRRLPILCHIGGSRSDPFIPLGALPCPSKGPADLSPYERAVAAQNPEVDALAQIAAGEFVRRMRAGEDPRKFRIDLLRQVSVPDRALKTLGRHHAVAVRIRVTCESLLFDKDGSAALVIPPST